MTSILFRILCQLGRHQWEWEWNWSPGATTARRYCIECGKEQA